MVAERWSKGKYWMKTLGIGMVGARYGARMHLANYAKLPRELVEIRGVCSRTKESGGELAREGRIAFVTDDYDSLLARKDIDVVDILGHWKQGLTTTFLEGLNSLFSATKRKARGYRSTEYQIAMLCFVAGKLEIPYYG